MTARDKCGNRLCAEIKPLWGPKEALQHTFRVQRCQSFPLEKPRARRDRLIFQIDSPRLTFVKVGIMPETGRGKTAAELFSP